MIIKNTFCCASTAAIVMGLGSFSFGETAEDIIKKHDSAKAQALEEYLTASPEAEDKAMALAALADSYRNLEEDDKLLNVLKLTLAAMPTGPDLNPQEFFGAFLEVFQSTTEAGDKDGAKALIASAREQVKGAPMEEQLLGALEQMAGQLNQPGVGDTLEIAFTSLQGDEVDLAKMNDKVVLIDFWATWCGPCIAELPHVKETYEKFHDKGFEVIAISLDENEDKLKDFIKENDLPWAQEFSGKGWESPLARKFGITGIPATFLVGKNGKVVASNLRGKALSEAVAKELESKDEA